MNITDMGAWSESQAVTAQQMNNIVYAIVRGNNSVTMHANVTPAMTQALQRAGMLAPANVTTQAGLGILVRLYENRTAQALTPTTALATIPGAAATNTAYHRGVRIAADLGMITGPINPTAPLTMGQLMTAIEIILIDMGM
jgi:hypothetical protein